MTRLVADGETEESGQKIIEAFVVVTKETRRASKNNNNESKFNLEKLEEEDISGVLIGVILW